MKTQVIHLDAHDEYISVRDKMNWSKTPRILLVFPPQEHILTDQLELKLLSRHASSLGAKLAVVSRSSELRVLCNKLKIDIFETTTSAQRGEWGDNSTYKHPDCIRKTPNILSRERKSQVGYVHPRLNPLLRLFIFTLGLASILSILFIFIPSATIQVTPQSQTRKFYITVQANLEIDKDGNALSPQDSTSYALASGNLISETSGTIKIPEGYANGEVYFWNLTGEEVIIPVGTIVRTLGEKPIRFATEEEITISGSLSTENNEHPVAITRVQALKPGSDGNVPAGSIAAIEGDLGVNLEVTNPESTAGGTESEVAAPTSEDRVLLKQALLRNLTEDCFYAILAQQEAGNPDIPGELKVLILSESYFPTEEQPGEILALTMEISCTNLKTEIQSLNGTDSANTKYPIGFLPQGRITILDHEDFQSNGELLEWKMTVEQPLIAQINPLSIIEDVMGKRTMEAEKLLATRPYFGSEPIIDIIPGWWPWIPIIPMRISVVQASATPGGPP